MKINLILAVDEKNGIGKDGKIPWHVSKDMIYFKEITSTTKDLAKLNAVIMGRNTWDSIPAKFRPLSDRVNCILTKSIKTNDIDSQIDNFVLYFNSLGTCILAMENRENIEEIYVIGGASVYNELIKTSLIDTIYITKIKGDFACDKFFDGIPDNFRKISDSGEKTEGDYKFNFEVWEKNK